MKKKLNKSIVISWDWKLGEEVATLGTIYETRIYVNNDSQLTKIYLTFFSQDLSVIHNLQKKKPIRAKLQLPLNS